MALKEYQIHATVYFPQCGVSHIKKIIRGVNAKETADYYEEQCGGVLLSIYVSQITKKKPYQTSWYKYSKYAKKIGKIEYKEDCSNNYDY